MNITIYDSDGNEIRGLTQWDANRFIEVSGVTVEAAPKVHFYNANSEAAYVADSTLDDATGSFTVRVPNVLLRVPMPITMCVFVEDTINDVAQGRTVAKVFIPVSPRVKPDGYMYQDDPGYFSVIDMKNYIEDIVDGIDGLTFGDGVTITGKAASTASVYGKNFNIAQNPAYFAPNAITDTWLVYSQEDATSSVITYANKNIDNAHSGTYTQITTDDSGWLFLCANSISFISDTIMVKTNTVHKPTQCAVWRTALPFASTDGDTVDIGNDGKYPGAAIDNGEVLPNTTPSQIILPEGYDPDEWTTFSIDKNDMSLHTNSKTILGFKFSANTTVDIYCAFGFREGDYVGKLMHNGEIFYPENIASQIKYNNETSGLDSTSVQDAIDELSGALDSTNDNLSILSENLGDIEALETTDKTDVVSAINEVNSQVNNLSGAEVSYDGTESGIEEDTIQGAIDSIDKATDAVTEDLANFIQSRIKKADTGFTSGGYINKNTGEIVPYSGWKYSALIEITSDVEIEYTVSDAYTYNAFYDEDEMFISHFDIRNFTVPSNAKYLRLSGRDTDEFAVKMVDKIYLDTIRSIEAVDDKIGDLADLDTTNKGDVISAINEVVEKTNSVVDDTDNLFDGTIEYHKRADGEYTTVRAITKVIAIPSESAYVKIFNLPDGMKFSVQWYTTSSYSSYVNGTAYYTDSYSHHIEGWSYISVMFGKNDDSAFVGTELDGIKIVVTNDVEIDAYIPYYSAKDTVIREEYYAFESQYEQEHKVLYDVAVSGEYKKVIDYLEDFTWERGGINSAGGDWDGDDTYKKRNYRTVGRYNLKTAVPIVFESKYSNLYGYQTGIRLVAFDSEGHSHGIDTSGNITDTIQSVANSSITVQPEVINNYAIRIQLNVEDNSFVLDETFDGFGMKESLRSSSSPKPVKLRVATFNVGHYCGGISADSGQGRVSELPGWRNLLAKLEADIIGVQENTNDAFAGGTTYEYIYNMLGYDKYDSVYNFGNPYVNFALYVTTQSDTEMNVKFPLEGIYGYKYCYITVGGKRVCFISAHLPWQSEAQRIRCHNELLSFLATQEYFILCGDFNTYDADDADATPWDEFVTYYENAGYHCASGALRGYKNTAYVSARTRFEPCDNIITSPNIGMRNIEVVDITEIIENHDHKPIVCELIIN